MKLIEPSTRDEWLSLRKGYISSTESAALFGYSPYLTAYELGVSKRLADKATTDELIGNERATWGLRLQDAIAQGVADDYGVQIRPMGLTYAVREDIRMGSSFDYQIVGTESINPNLAGPQLVEFFNRLGPGLLEVKNVDSLEYKRKWIDDEAPDHIEIQLQHQLECLGLPWGAIACLIGGNRVGLIIRERDRKVGEVITRRIREFWTNFDRGVLPNPQMPEDASVIIALYQLVEPGKVIENHDDDLTRLFFQYNQMAQTEKGAKEQKKALQAQIFQKIGTAERVIDPKWTLSATMVAPYDVAAYKNPGYRGFKLTKKEVKDETDSVTR